MRNTDMLRIQRLDLKLWPANIRGSQVKGAVWKFVAKAGTWAAIKGIAPPLPRVRLPVRVPDPARICLHLIAILELFSTVSQQHTRTTGSDNALLKLTTMSHRFHFLNKILSSQFDEPHAYMQTYYEQTCIILLDCRDYWKCPCFMKLYSYFCIHICFQPSLSEGISYTDPPFVTTLLGIIRRPFLALVTFEADRRADTFLLKWE